MVWLLCEMNVFQTKKFCLGTSSGQEGHPWLRTSIHIKRNEKFHRQFQGRGHLLRRKKAMLETRDEKKGMTLEEVEELCERGLGRTRH